MGLRRGPRGVLAKVGQGGIAGVGRGRKGRGGARNVCLPGNMLPMAACALID